ncbi:MAG: SDR family oxidoreductase [Candidatus Methylacidiphilales bacterium]
MAEVRPKHIVLTGCTRGLGRALVDEFANRGHYVSGCGRSPQEIKKLSELYPKSRASFSVLDVTDLVMVKKWAAGLCETQGKPDLLINNAAVINDPMPLWKVTPDDFSRVIDVNIKGVFHVLHAFLPAMLECRAGVIVNMSSGWGRSTSPEVAAYCASKFAIEGLTRSLAQELPHGITAVALNPGIIDTDMLRQCWEEGASGYEKPAVWARRAAPFILSISSEDQGSSLSV